MEQRLFEERTWNATQLAEALKERFGLEVTPEAVRQHLIAAGFAMSVASVWGTLEMFELVPHVGAFYIVLLWAVGIFVGMIVNRTTHGVWGQCP